MFRQFFDTSFQDYRQLRVVVQELPSSPLKRTSSDFRRFCENLLNHKSFTYENFKIEYCFIRQDVIINESILNEIQLYRRPFAIICFTVCHTRDEFQMVLDEFSRVKQRERYAYSHLFVRHRTANSIDEADDENEEYDEDDINEDDMPTDGKLNDDTSYENPYRPSISSMNSFDLHYSLPQSAIKPSVQQDETASLTSDSTSLTNSFSGAQGSNTADNDGLLDYESDTTASVSISIKKPTDSSIKRSKFGLIKTKTLPAGNIFDSFDTDVSRTLLRLENSLSTYIRESKGFDTMMPSIDSQFADIRLMINCEKDCSLLENFGPSNKELTHDRVFTTVLDEFDMRVMQTLFNEYLKANVNLAAKFAKTKLSKKLIDLRAIKRKGDCCLLLGSIEKAIQDYQRATDSLKTQNDLLWHAAAMEARAAANYLSVQKPKRSMQKTFTFLKQMSLTKIDKYFNRSNSVVISQPKIEAAIQVYSAANRLSPDTMEFQLELDACIRWCSFLQEQNDVKKYRNDIEQYMHRINILGSYLQRHIDSIYLNAYLAEAYAYVGFKRKSALYYRSSAFSGLSLLEEQESYMDEIDFFDELIKQARKGYGIEDNQTIFPLIQKTIINESIQIALKKNDFTTIIENVHFAIESLLQHMTNDELEALLSFLNATDQSISCSYCSIPRLKSLDPMPLPNRLRAYKVEPKDLTFIYHAKRTLPSQQQSLHRKVDFLWVRKEQAQIELIMDNYLPESLTIDRLEFIADNQLSTKLETKYHIPARTTKSLLVDCIPNDIGQLRIQGLRYHIWSTNQKFCFEDFPSLRQCTCSIYVVDELPVLDIKYLIVNNIKIDITDYSKIYNVQVHRGEELFVALGLTNSSTTCDIDTLDIQVFAFGSNMTDDIKITGFELPIYAKDSANPKLNLSEIYSRCLSRQDRSTTYIESLSIEFRLNYSNESSNTTGYYRQSIVQLRLEYSSSLTLEINDIQNDDDDLSYLICSKIDNHLQEDVLLPNNNRVHSLESAIKILKQNKIKLNTFSSDLNQLIEDIRQQLPSCINCKTVDSNKQFSLPIDWQNFSNDTVQEHITDLIHPPYTCNWHFERIMNMLRIHLCIKANYCKLSKLEIRFPLSNCIRYLNSNKILFRDIEVGKYLSAERILISSKENTIDVLVVDVFINDVKWKRITLTF